MNLSAAGYANGTTGLSEALVPSDGRRAAAGSAAARLWEQCTGFESLFLNAMMKQMRESVHAEGGALAPSPARKMMESMFDERMVERLAERGTAGIADSLYRDFRRHDLVRKATAESGGAAPSQPVVDGLA